MNEDDAVPTPDECAWWQDTDAESDTWATDCGKYFTLNDGTPNGNGFEFCCFCGGGLVEVPFANDDDNG